MSRRAVIFEDAGWRRLYPISLSRPSFDCRAGVTTLGWRLITQLARHDVRRVDFLVRPELRPQVERDYAGHAANHQPEGDLLFLNGRLLCLGDGLQELIDLLDRAVAVQIDDELAAFRVTGAAGGAAWNELSEALEAGEPAPMPRDHTVAPAPEPVRMMRHLWDLIAVNGEVLEDDAAWIQHPPTLPALAPGAQVLHRDRVLAREGSRLEAGAILDASHGPIFLGEGASVLHNAVVTGPAYVGAGTTVKMGARIEGPVTLGPVCRVGGEVEGSIVQGYANKQHDGFLGHAYLGSWTNLGAGTNNSDLKNNYSTVRVWTPEGDVDTGLRSVGVFVGDHSKTAIATRLNTGTVVGFSCNVLMDGFPPKHIPSFSWAGPGGVTPYDLEKALDLARTVMHRRHVSMEPADEVLFRRIHAEATGG